MSFRETLFSHVLLIMGCVASKSKLIFISSREVDGETSSAPTREDDPLVPSNIYGLTKLLDERLVLWAALRYGLDFTILRLTNVYGPEGDQYNVQAMIRKVLTEGRIRILGGSQQTNLVYVEDVAEVVRRCLSRAWSNETINVGSYDSVSVTEIVSRLVSFVGVRPIIECLPMRNGETLSFRPSLEKVEIILGYRPSTKLDDGLAKTFQWYRTHLQQ